MIQINEELLIDASKKGVDSFIEVFINEFIKVVGPSLSSEKMDLLNSDQHTLYAYNILRNELMEGGFCQLIQNGYGSYIFDNPFAKALRFWDLQDLSKLIYKAKKIYDKHKLDLERDRSFDEFMAMYEQYESFDDLEEYFIENEEEFTQKVAEYVDEHLSRFAEIIYR